MKSRITLRRSGAILGGAIMALLWAASPAHGATGVTTVDIRAGNNGELVGTATFTRTLDDAGNETLTIDLSVPTGIDKAHVCVGAEPYTTRISSGQCPYQQQKTGTTARFVIPLGTASVGKPVYTQTSVVTNGNTAFAGWQEANPFYGNLRIAAVVGTVEAATGQLVGSITLTVLLGGTLGLALAISRRRGTGRTGTKANACC